MKYPKILRIFILALCLLPGTVLAKTLRIGLITPPSHQWTITAQGLAEDLAKASGGELELAVFPAGQLGNEAAMLQQLQSGALDLAFLAAGEVANRSANFSALFAPYLVNTPIQGRELLQGPTALAMLEDLKQLGLIGLGYGMAGMRQIVMKGEVKSVKDLAGRKIRIMPVAPERDFWSKVGAAPTPIPLPALYDAFANGQVDGMQIDFEGTWNTRYLDHADTIIESSHMMLPMVAVASGRSWKALSAAQREQIQSTVGKRLSALFEAYEAIDRDYFTKIKGSGITVIHVDRVFFGDVINAWYAEWRVKAPALEALEKDAQSILGQ
ncbi:MAG: TRAP transporter substrate-binding protein [Gammaproteobacteria bacterium]|nr:TRAP transporter substrate-binding protein [Gammaproteobacteria bacterium]